MDVIIDERNLGRGTQFHAVSDAVFHHSPGKNCNRFRCSYCLPTMSLESPAPKLEAFAQSFDGLVEVLEPLLSQPLSQLSKRLQAGSSSSAAAAPAAPTPATTAATGTSTAPAEGKQDEPLSQKQIEREGKLASARMYASTAYVLLDLVWSTSSLIRCRL